MIGKVTKGRRVGGLLRYLYGPGRANEHTNPHLAAAWDEPATLEPALDEDGRLGFRALTGLLEQTLRAVDSMAARPVWHCALRTAPGDRRLSDAEWDDVAREVLDRTGLAPRDTDGGCRWVAVRHADDHIHLVVTLARQDRARVSTSNDFYRVGEACRAVEDRYGLTLTGTRDRTAATRATRGEIEKAGRARRDEPPRVTLRREVQVAAAAASGPGDFLDRLRAAGLLVRERYSELDPTQVTGYAVALPGDRNARGQPVWFGGGKLAADLSWPKLASRWATAGSVPRQRTATAGARTGARRAAWSEATRAAHEGASEVRRLAASDPGACTDIAHAAGATLTSAARAVEGRRGGPLTDAADLYDRATREPWGRTGHPTRAGHRLRAAARLLARTGRARGGETTQVLVLVAAMADLVAAVAQLRDAQARTVQAQAARRAANLLREAPARPRPVPVPARSRSRAAQQRRRRELFGPDRSTAGQDRPEHVAAGAAPTRYSS